MANKKWTVMVYMAGDNDLYEDMADKLIEIQKPFQNDVQLQNINLSVYFDGGNPMIRTQQFNFNRSLAGRPAPHGNAADPKSVSEFVKWSVQDEALSADRYALIFSGHGDGFQRTAFLRDMSSFDFMSVRKLKEELSRINREFLGKTKLDVLAFDSCVMSMFEVLNEFKEIAQLVVASEGYMPTTGLSYKHLLEELQSVDGNEEISAEELTNIIVGAAKENNENFAKLTLRSLDISVLDLDTEKFDAAVQSLNDLGAALEDVLTYQAPISDDDYITVESLKSALLSSHSNSQTYLFDQAVDVVDFCENLKSECFSQMFEKHIVLQTLGLNFMNVVKSDDGSKILNVELVTEIPLEDAEQFKSIINCLQKIKDICDKCEAVILAFRRCVVRSCFSGPDYQYSNGVAVYFPWSVNTFEMTKYKFKEYNFACREDDETKLNPWYSFLQKYLSETIRPQAETLKLADADLFNFKFLSNREELLFAGRVLLDPPPRGMLASENQYKEYFRRIKNFPLKYVTGCSK